MRLNRFLISCSCMLTFACGGDDKSDSDPGSDASADAADAGGSDAPAPQDAAEASKEDTSNTLPYFLFPLSTYGEGRVSLLWAS